MRHRNIRSFLETLRRESELHVIEVPVDPDLELAEIQRRVVAHEGPALLFTNVTGSKFPVATNLFGTRRRIELAFGEDPERFFRRVAEAVEILAAPSVSKLWEFRDIAKTALRLGTRRLRSGPVIECVMNPPRLKDLPQIRSWPMDGGAFLTLPLVYTEHPLTGKPNLGMYRNQIFDDRVAGMHFQIHRGLGFHYHEAEKMLKPLPANIFLGGPPALIMSAIAPLPENVPEAVLASLLQGQKLEIIRDERISRLRLLQKPSSLSSDRFPVKFGAPRVLSGITTAITHSRIPTPSLRRPVYIIGRTPYSRRQWSGVQGRKTITSENTSGLVLSVVPAGDERCRESMGLR